MEKITITEASKLVQVCRDKIRYGSKLLGIKLIKQGRVSYVPTSSITLLQAMYKSVASGVSPKLAAKEVLEIHASPLEPQQATTKAISNNVLTDRIETLEQAVMLLVESNKKLSEDNKRLHTQNNMILEQVKLIRMSKEPLKHKTFQVWQPPIKQAAKVSFIKRLWLEVFNPEALRA